MRQGIECARADGWGSESYTRDLAGRGARTLAHGFRSRDGLVGRTCGGVLGRVDASDGRGENGRGGPDTLLQGGRRATTVFEHLSAPAGHRYLFLRGARRRARLMAGRRAECSRLAVRLRERAMSHAGLERGLAVARAGVIYLWWWTCMNVG
ncbi:hypothetical protein BV20DRAFT_372177 [Pilatotrama ljubarskyi]|nr:hypothetical protein BV20DRAFT_372177 [Pilatotrama ljubarskyi]